MPTRAIPSHADECLSAEYDGCNYKNLMPASVANCGDWARIRAICSREPEPCLSKNRGLEFPDSFRSEKRENRPNLR